MRLAQYPTDFLAEYVASRINCPTVPHGSYFGTCTGSGIETDAGRLVGAVIYYGWQRSTGDIHLAVACESPLAARPAIIREVLAYPFAVLGCRRVTATTRHDDTRAIRGLRGCGFVREGCRRHAYGDAHAADWGCTREDYERWVASGGRRKRAAWNVVHMKAAANG